MAGYLWGLNTAANQQRANVNKNGEIGIRKEKLHEFQ